MACREAVMKIGITGTRSGMNAEQSSSLRYHLSRFAHVTEFHHGDCVGVDDQAATIANNMDIQTVCHPPVDESLRAHHNSTVILEQKNHFARNRNIVDSVDLLFVVPYQDEWQSRGGTWYTHDYAKKKGVETFTIWPSEEAHQLISQGR